MLITGAGMTARTTLTCMAMAAAVWPAAAASFNSRPIKLETRDGRPVIDEVFINDRGPYRFLIDTGATFNHIDRRLAEAAGLTPMFQTKLVSAPGVTVTSGHSGSSV